MSGRLFLIVLLTAVLLAGCVGNAPPADDEDPAGAAVLSRVAVVSDPPGDATEVNEETVRGAAHQCEHLAPASCAAVLHAVPHGVADAGTPAPPALDLEAVWFRETPVSLFIEIEVAGLEDGLEGAAPADGSRATRWHVCWDSLEQECAYVWAKRVNGALDTAAWFDRYSDCSDWYWCSWEVRHEIVPGEPGTVRIEVPRALLSSADEGTWLRSVYASSVRAFDVGEHLQWSAPTQDMGGWFTPGHISGGSDTTATGEFRFASVLDGTFEPAPLSEPSTDARNEVPTAELLELRVEEDTETVSLVAAFAQVDVLPPEGHGYRVVVGLPSGRVIEAGFGTTSTGIESWSTEPAEFEARPGTPGEVAFTFSRDVLDALPVDSWTTLLLAEAWTPAVAPGDPALPLLVSAAGGHDQVGPLPPHLFQGADDGV